MTGQDLTVLIQQYSKPLIRYANSILKDLETAKEVVQDCFIKALAQEKSAIKIPGWLYREVRNRSIDIWRHRRKIEALEPDKEENLISEHPHPLETLEVQEDLKQLAKQVKSLPAREQEILRLKYS